jgi:hypothetical protein
MHPARTMIYWLVLCLLGMGILITMHEEVHVREADYFGLNVTNRSMEFQGPNIIFSVTTNGTIDDRARDLYHLSTSQTDNIGYHLEAVYFFICLIGLFIIWRDAHVSKHRGAGDPVSGSGEDSVKKDV